MRHRLYIETSFWKRLTDPSDPERRRISYSFLRTIAGRDQILISSVVREELRDTPDAEERKTLFRRLSGVRPRTITTTPRVGRIARDLLSLGGWGARRVADVLHVSYAVFARADALVSWDVHDLARERMREVARTFGRMQGVPVPWIGTPQEVAEWLELPRIR